MNFLSNQDQLECIVDPCPLYVHTDASPYFLITVVFPHYLTVGLLALSLYKQEVYILLVSLALTANFGINILLQRIFRDPPRFPGCYATFGGPSFATQHLILFDVIVMTYPYFFGHVPRLKGIIVTRVCVMLTLFTWVYIGANTSLELFTGAIVGTIYALLFQVFVYMAIFPRVSWFLSWRICRYLDVEDTMMRLGMETIPPTTTSIPILYAQPVK